MAYSDSPLIDKPAINSEKSELSVKMLMNQESGFLLRADVPDKGCDFDAELLLNKMNVSNWRFPIQVKSIEKLTLINNREDISYSFETSRLGYLIRRIPSGGLVILYSVEENKCFYEDSERIYNRLMQDRESEDWKANDKVSIRIPYKNELSAVTAQKIHDLFLQRFLQATMMQRTHGAKYGLPSESLGGDKKYDFNNTSDIKSFLVEYGLLLLNNYDLTGIYNLMVKIPNAEIYADKDLLMIAAVSFSEAARYIDSEVYVRKLQKMFPLNDSENTMIQFVSLKNKYALADITFESFVEQLSELDSPHLSSQNRITLEINIMHYQLGKLNMFDKKPEHLIDSVRNTQTAIDRLKANYRIKGTLTLWNYENFSLLINIFTSDVMGDFQIKEALGTLVDVPTRIAAAERIAALEKEFNSKVIQVNESASVNNDKLLKAFSLSLSVKHLIDKLINMTSFKMPIKKFEGFDKKIENTISFAFTAYNYFRELNFLQEAYDNLQNALELIIVFEYYYDKKLTHSKEQAEAIREKMEAELDISRPPGLFSDIAVTAKPSGDRSMAFLLKLDDDQIEDLAQTALNSFNLPSDRLIHIINELKGYRLFHQRCTDQKISVILQRSPFQPDNESYQYPVQFMLVNKTAGVQSLPNSDMNLLLSSWGY